MTHAFFFPRGPTLPYGESAKERKAVFDTFRFVAVERPSKSARSVVCGRGRTVGFGRDLNLDFAAAGDSTRVLSHKV